jgi:hypothetical protein
MGVMEMINEELMILSAQRIKECRKLKGLSHKKLADILSNKYNISISLDALKVYEIDNKYHTRFGNIKGMKIQYIYCLADFYGVSTDYLLGMTDIKAPNITIKAISNFTGLNEGAINTLRENLEYKFLRQKNLLNTINFLLEQDSIPQEVFENEILYNKVLKEGFTMILSKIDEFLSYEPKLNKKYIVKDGKLIEDENGMHTGSQEEPISESDIVEEAYLSEIKTRLKECKQILRSREE